MKNGKLKIEKGVPIPPPAGRNKNGQTDLMRAMKVGDSIHLDLNYHNAWQAARYALGVGAFVVRRDGDGHRVWRK